MTDIQKKKSFNETLCEFEDKLKAIEVSIGGCALLRNLKPDGHYQYILVEHPYENRYLINHDLFYNQPLDIMDGAELLYKFETKELYREKKTIHDLGEDFC